MKKLTVKRGSDTLEITAPEGKEMVINENQLIQGVLSIGEYGSSGIKIASFINWDEAIFDAEDHGYTIIEKNPF